MEDLLKYGYAKGPSGPVYLKQEDATEDTTEKSEVKGYGNSKN